MILCKSWTTAHVVTVKMKNYKCPYSFTEKLRGGRGLECSWQVPPAELSGWPLINAQCHTSWGHSCLSQGRWIISQNAVFSPGTSPAKQQLQQMTCFRQPKAGKINPTCAARQHYLLKLHLHFSGHINIAIYVPFLLGGNCILHFCLTHAPTSFCFYHTFVNIFSPISLSQLLMFFRAPLGFKIVEILFRIYSLNWKEILKNI